MVTSLETETFFNLGHREEVSICFFPLTLMNLENERDLCRAEKETVPSNI